MTVKELTKELHKERYDQKNLPVVIKLPNGETYDASILSKYDDMAVIEATPRDAQLENGESMYGAELEDK